MRRAVPLVIAVSGLVLGAALPAAAREPSPSAQAPPPNSAAQPVCTITDSRMTELSGLVTTATGYVTVDDGKDNGPSRIFYLDTKCKLIKTVNYPAPGPRDPEDLAIAPDGTLWIADIGDNITSASRRSTIALWSVPAAGGNPVLHHLTYPDHAHDAEALLLAADGTPIIFTKELRSPAGIYVPSGPLATGTTNVPLRKVGEFQPQRTGTANFLGIDGQNLVTGGANAPDGRRVALRTYSDAYEWDVPDGDVVKAITTGKPRITPMANEPQGESIAYTRDGSAFLTVSDQREPTRIFRYTPASVAKPPVQGGAGGAPVHQDTRGFLEKLSLGQITALVGLVGGFGLVLVLAGALGIWRSRRARRRRAANGGPPDGRAEGDERAAPRTVTGRVYGGRADAGEPPNGARGAQPGGAYTGGGTYSGGTYSGNTYGGGTYSGSYRPAEPSPSGRPDDQDSAYRPPEYRGSEHPGR